MVRKEVIGNATLYLGDCMEILPTLGKVDAVITDPPFNVGKDYGVHDDAMPEADYLAWMESVIVACRGASDALWFVVPTSKMLAFWRMLPTAQQVVVPMKAGYAVRSGWTQKFASLLVEGRPPANPWNLWEGIRHRGEGYFFKEDTFNHPGYTPLPIMARAVEASGADAILDPFMGTGTSGVAALQHDKKYIGVELSPAYFDIACKRIEQAHAQGQLFEPTQAAPVQLGLEAA